MVKRMKNPKREVTIGLVGKYVEYEDSYKSLKEALLHAGIAHQARVNIEWIESEQMEWPRLLATIWRGSMAFWCPAGSESAASAGMLNAIRCARERSIPYFGICLGMQTMVIEFARNVCGLADADSTEFNPGNTASRHLQASRAEGRR